MGSAGKQMWVIHDYFWFHLWLDDQGVWVKVSQSCNVVMQNQLFFDTQVKTRSFCKNQVTQVTKPWAEYTEFKRCRSRLEISFSRTLLRSGKQKLHGNITAASVSFMFRFQACGDQPFGPSGYTLHNTATIASNLPSKSFRPIPLTLRGINNAQLLWHRNSNTGVQGCGVVSCICCKCLTLALRYPTLPVRPCAMDSCIIVSSARVL